MLVCFDLLSHGVLSSLRVSFFGCDFRFLGRFGFRFLGRCRIRLCLLGRFGFRFSRSRFCSLRLRLCLLGRFGFGLSRSSLLCFSSFSRFCLRFLGSCCFRFDLLC